MTAQSDPFRHSGEKLLENSISGQTINYSRVTGFDRHAAGMAGERVSDWREGVAFASGGG